jgi:hypothetical protein
LNNKESLEWKIFEKWCTTLSPNYNIKWRDVWRKNCTKKDVGFIWVLCHKPIALNAWKVQMHKDVDENCPMCDLEISITLIHRFLNVQELRWPRLWLV